MDERERSGREAAAFRVCARPGPRSDLAHEPGHCGVTRVLDGIDAFLDQLGSVEVVPLLLAVACHLLKMACTSRAWRNVLAAAYPGEKVPWRRSTRRTSRASASTRSSPHAPATRSASTSRTARPRQHVHDRHLEHARALALRHHGCDARPLLGDRDRGLARARRPPRLESFDFAFLLDRPLAFQLTLAAVVVGLVILGVWVHGHVVNFWERVKQAFSVLRPPTRYLRSVAAWQAADWSLRLLTIWFLLDAFDIPQSVHNAALVQVSQSTATLLPITPGGLGTEQAFLLYVLSGLAPASVLLAFSVGARITITTVNVIAGFTAIGITMRTFRYSKAMRPSGRRRAPRRTGLVQLAVQRACRLLREPGHALELLLRRVEEDLDRAEVTEDRPSPHGPDAVEGLEDRLHRLRAAALAVVAQRNAMGLVACPLEQLQRGAGAVEPDRLRRAGDEHLLLALRERDDRDAGKVELLHRRERGRELPASPSTTTRFGTREKLSSGSPSRARANRRAITSRIAPTSSGPPCTPRIANVR